MTKVSARWVPRNLTAHDRHQRVTSRELLDLYMMNITFQSMLLLMMKHGYTTGIQKAKCSLSNGNMLPHHHQGNSELNHQPARLWKQYFGTATDYF